nr:hypothetical protein [Tanacetum cinerariifolium]
MFIRGIAFGVYIIRQSQKGSGVGRGVKEKQVSITDKSIEVSKHANVVNTGLDLFSTISEVHGIHSLACNEENMNDVGTRVGPTPAGNTPGMSSYANVTGGLSRKDMNFRTLFTPKGNEVDMVVSWSLLELLMNGLLIRHMVSFWESVCHTSLSLTMSSYARALIEVRADVELKDNILVAMPKLVREGFYTCNVRVDTSTTPIIEKIDKIERLIIDGTATFVDDEGKRLTRVNSLGNHDREDEVASESYEDGEYDYDPSGDDMYEGHDIPNMIQDICDNLDIKVRGLFGGNTRDLDSIGDENGTKTQPYKIFVKVGFTARGDGVVNHSDAINISRRRHDPFRRHQCFKATLSRSFLTPSH